MEACRELLGELSFKRYEFPPSLAGLTGPGREHWCMVFIASLPKNCSPAHLPSTEVGKAEIGTGIFFLQWRLMATAAFSNPPWLATLNFAYFNYVQEGWVLGLWRKKQQSEDDFMKSGADDCGEINRPALYNSFPKSSAAPLKTASLQRVWSSGRRGSSSNLWRFKCLLS